jgi:hypothetical protein
MSTTAVITPEALSLLREGWTLLVKQLGIQKATRFVLLLELKRRWNAKVSIPTTKVRIGG